MDLQDYYRQKRRRAAARIFGVSLVLLLVALAASWGFFWIPLFRITQIKVYNYPAEESVKNAVKLYLESRNKIFLPKNSFWLLDAADIENILKSKTRFS